MTKGITKLILENDLTDKLSKDDLNKFKKVQRRKYQKIYQKEWREQRLRVELFLVGKKAKQFEKAMKQYGYKSKAAFAEVLIFSALSEVYVVPDEEQVRQLELGILKIGTNINQAVKRINTYGSESTDEAFLSKKIKELEEVITNVFRNPKSLKELILEEVKKNPVFLPQLKISIEAIENDT